MIDASVSPEVYLGLAKGKAWKIQAVVETHVHADHLWRGPKLAGLAGARLFLPDQKRARFPFSALFDGDHVEIGPCRLEALHTPGHTPESTCYLLDGKALFTGDTLFVDAVGRTDLAASAEELKSRARALYLSLQKLRRLPPETVILPTHTGRPAAFDRRPIAAPWSETSARLETLNLPEEEFVEYILSRLPETPPNHLRIIELNEAGEFPEGDPTDLEAGANRCAIA